MGVGLLAKVLFSVAGRGITVKHVLLAILGIILAVGIFLGFRVVNDHFQHIRDLENKNVQLERDKQSLQTQLSTAVETNKNNLAVDQTHKEITHHNQDLATQERAATQVRSQKYREIRDAIDNTPAPTPSRSDQPVAPVVRNTLDGLWGPAPSNSQPGGNPRTHGLR